MQHTQSVAHEAAQDNILSVWRTMLDRACESEAPIHEFVRLANLNDLMRETLTNRVRRILEPPEGYYEETTT